MKILKKNPKRIYFMMPVYLVGGGELLVCRIIEYLSLFTDIKIGVIDFPEGMLTRTCKKFFKNENIDYVDYNSDVWTLEDDSLIFCGADHLGCIKIVKGKDIRIKIILWEGVTGWDILFEKKTIKKIGKLLNKNHAITFIDSGCLVAGCKQLMQNFEQDYIPIYYYIPPYKILHRCKSDDTINLLWLGRFAGSKIYSIYNIIENFVYYKTKRKKIFHLIGNGPFESDLKNYCKNYSDQISFKFTGVLTGQELVNYIQLNADVGVAMGTSMFNIASLKIPVIMAHQSNRRFSSSNFNWLKDIDGHCLGTHLLNHELFRNQNEKKLPFDSMIREIELGNGNIIGQACFDIYEKKYGSLLHLGENFINSIQRTSLTWSMLKSTLKFLPYDDVNGIAVHYFKCLGLPIFKSIYHKNIIRLYIFGLYFMKICYKHHHRIIKFFNIEVWSDRWWGRYDYYEATNPKVRRECKDKFVISEKVFDSNK